MAYTKDEYKKLRLNVMDFGSDLFSNIKELLMYKEFMELRRVLKTTKIDVNKVIKYIALIHDKNSPLLRESDLKKRKIEAAKIAGFDELDGVFRRDYFEILQNKGINQIPINKAIVRYVRLQNDSDFLLLCIYDETLINNIAELAGEKNQDEQKKLLNNIKILSSNISELKDKFLIDDSDRLYSELMEEMANHNLELLPEQLVIKQEARLRVLDQGNPYEDYKKEYYELKDFSDEEKVQFEKDMTNDTNEAREHFKALGIEHEGEISINKNKEIFNKVFNGKK